MAQSPPGSGYRVVAYGQTDVGRRRERNEDAFLINPDLQLYIVADGMGGHVGGGFASRMAVNTIEEVVTQLTADPEATLEDGEEVRPNDYKSLLRYAVQTASHRIYAKAGEDPALRGMGTTTVALLVRDQKAYIANVGDSRGYCIRGSEMKQVTVDHSLVGEQMRAGIISESDAKGHRLRNIITRSVGFQDLVDIDVAVRPVKVGDIYLLCTDGLTNMVEDPEIFSVITHNSLRGACQQLIDLANERGGDDNVTVLTLAAEKMRSNASRPKEAVEDLDEPTIELEN